MFLSREKNLCFQELLPLNLTLQKILKIERQLSSSCFAKVLFCGVLAPTLLQWLQMRPNLGHLSPPGYIIFISACLHYIYLRLVTLYLSPPGYITFISAWLIYLSLPGYIILISAWLHYIYLRLVFLFISAWFIYSCPLDNVSSGLSIQHLLALTL